jgi:hypothetical protein
MDQFNAKEVVYHYRNGVPLYYSYDEELYCGTFPEAWAKNHLNGSGPKECKNCNWYGSWNGVFLGYCANCAYYAYNGERGRGLVDIGKENGEETITHQPSIFETYLKDINPHGVGDTDFMDSAKYVNYIDIYNNDIEDLLVPVDYEYDDNNENQKGYEKEDKKDEYYIDIDEINAHYDELCRKEREREREDDYGIGAGYSINIDTCYYGSSYDGGYDSH